MVVFLHATLPAVGVEDIVGGERAWLAPFNYIGLFGVDLFFAISGFIMLVTSWGHFGKQNASLRFFARRAIRIYPPYWLALAPILPVLLLAKDRFMVAHVGVKTGIIESILLLPNPNKFVLTVAWTLVWEMLFYVVFAVILNFDRRIVAYALAAWLIAELVLFATLNSSPNFYLNFIAAPIPIEFILGAFAGILYMKKWLPAPSAFAALAVGATATAWSWVIVHHIELQSPNDINRVIIFGIPAALIVYAAVSLEARRKFVGPAILTAIGDASYAIYLWHLAILVVLRHILISLHPAGPLAHAAILLLTLAVVVAVGMLIYRFFERPVTTYLNGLLTLKLPRAAVQPAREPVHAK